MSDKLTSTSGGDPSAKTISVPVFHLYHKLLPGADVQPHVCPRADVSLLQSSSDGADVAGQPLPLEMTLAQLLTLLYERKLPQGYQSISLAVKLGSRVISDSGLSKTDSFKRLRTEKGRNDTMEHQGAPAGSGHRGRGNPSQQVTGGPGPGAS